MNKIYFCSLRKMKSASPTPAKEGKTLSLLRKEVMWEITSESVILEMAQG